MTARRPLREDERRAWLRLSRTETIGATTFAALMARFSDVREALAAAPRLARRGGAESLRMPSDADAEDEIERLAGLGGRLIASIEPDFPSGLAALDPPPPMIECGHFQASDDRRGGRAQRIRAWHQIRRQACGRSRGFGAGGGFGIGARDRSRGP